MKIALFGNFQQLFSNNDIDISVAPSVNVKWLKVFNKQDDLDTACIQYLYLVI